MSLVHPGHTGNFVGYGGPASSEGIIDLSSRFERCLHDLLAVQQRDEPDVPSRHVACEQKQAPRRLSRGLSRALDCLEQYGPEGASHSRTSGPAITG